MRLATPEGYCAMADQSDEQSWRPILLGLAALAAIGWLAAGFIWWQGGQTQARLTDQLAATEGARGSLASDLQNLLIDPDWHIWMIDHTRAFRLHTSLQEQKNLVQCDRKLLAKLRALDTNSLNSLKPYVTPGEIKGLLGRRDKIVKFFDDQVAQKGEGAVLYDRPTR